MSENKYEFTLNTAEMNDSHMGLAVRIKSKQRVLELGCSSGYLSKFLKQDLDCTVVGVDIDSHSAEQAKPYCDKVIVADLDKETWLAEIKGQQFDIVLCADVLEHLKDPVALLTSLKPFLHDDSLLLASVPNVAHASIRLELLQGHFDYESLGILDDTHLHFYTRNGLVLMLMQAGYVCCDISYSVHDLADEAIDQNLKNVGLVASEKTRELLHAPDAIAFQFIIEARPAKAELVENLPQPLIPKPLVSSGIFYSEKQEMNAALEERVVGLERQISEDKIHHDNYKKNISDLEGKIIVLERQLSEEKEHNNNHFQNIGALNEVVKKVEIQRDGEIEHNKNHLVAIEAWEKTTSVLDNELFDLADNLKIEQQNNADLRSELQGKEEQVTHLTSDNHRLENVLKRVHSKVSYRALQWLKKSPQKITEGFSNAEKRIVFKEDKSTVHSYHDYSAWVCKNESLLKKELSSFASEITSWENKPKIAVLMPVYNPEKACLVNAIESVLEQVYENFELCIADDASTKSYVKDVLTSYAEKDQRIKLIFREQNGHISAASNNALTLVEADYVALMDHDDLLTRDALFWIAKTIQQNPDVALIYSDEDKKDLDGNRYAPYFKPDWNPELLLSHNYICHLGIYKTDIVRSIGGFDSVFDGAQDYDLALRYIEQIKADQIVHIPRILYHWRAVEGSTANGIHEKPYAEAVIAKAVTNSLQRKDRAVEVLSHKRLPGAIRVRYLLPKILPLVSIIIPTRNGFELLRRCIESIFDRTQYSAYEIIIIDNGSDDLVAVRYLQRLSEDERVTIIRDDSPFNYAALNNKAVAQAKGEIIALLNNDLEVINDDWLDEMVSHAVHPEVGAVGAKLYYPDDTIQHAGVIVGLGGVAGHSHKHFPRDNAGYCGRLLVTQNLSAVTAACLVVRKSVFDAVGGFDEKNLSVAFNDVDFCLRVKEQGFYNVWTPYAELYHYESATRGYEDTPEKQARFNREVAYMKRRWGDGLLVDDAYNPNLTLDREDFSFA